MKPEDQEFQELRRLLALKRHETPPPGYFANFSGKVIARIEAEAAVGARPWWSRLLAGLDLRPAVACAYSLAIGGLLIVGLSAALDQPAAPTAHLHLPSLDQPLLAAQPALASATDPSQPQLTLQPMPLPGQEPSAMGAVLNPDAAPSGLFRPDGFFGTGNLPEQSPASLNFRR